MKYVIAIDQSTSGTKAALIDENLTMVRSLRQEHTQFYPKPGWVEHDAEEIWQNTAALLRKLGSSVERREIAGIGIANQRETIVLWERTSGAPVAPAVVWQDVRAKYITDPLASQAEKIRKATGLSPSPYYSAAKAAALLREDPDLAARARRGELCFGTIDSYLLYRLTGGASFATDLSNAGRTQLLNISRLEWDPELTSLFGIPSEMLAEQILPSDSCFGLVTALPELEGIPITAMMGDSNASLFGHGCTQPGMVKTSYGTGSSIMMNIGGSPRFSENGLSTSIGFSWGGQLSYVLEGNVTCSADTLVWLREELQLIGDMKELELASSVPDTDGVYLVPAFAGLGAPWFDEKARAILYGMNRGTTKAHILRAALASIAHQNADVLDAMAKDTGTRVTHLRADGGGSVNPLLMQMQSDYVPCEVAASQEKDLTILGVGKMAGLHRALFRPESLGRREEILYRPRMSEVQRQTERQGWANAIARCR